MIGITRTILTCSGLHQQQLHTHDWTLEGSRVLLSTWCFRQSLQVYGFVRIFTDLHLSIRLYT